MGGDLNIVEIAHDALRHDGFFTCDQMSMGEEHTGSCRLLQVAARMTAFVLVHGRRWGQGTQEDGGSDRC